MGVTGGSGGVSSRGEQGEVGESERGVAVAGGGGWQGGGGVGSKLDGVLSDWFQKMTG